MKKINITLILLSLFSFQGFAQSEILEAEQAKELCEPMNKDFLFNHFGTDKVAHKDYLDLVNSRTTEVEKGEQIKTYVLQDQYRYKTVEHGVRLYKMANGYSGDTVPTNETIYLPFCANEGSRDIATIGNIETKIDDSIEDANRKLKFSLSAQYGNLDVSNSTEDISMNFIKLSAGANYKLNDDYFLTGTLSAVQFRNIEHTATDRTQSASDLYPELGLSLFKRAGKINYGIGYDYLQYFVRDPSITGVSLTPSQTHRISPKISYSLTENLSLISSVGVLRSFEENNISGFDAVVGANYAFGKKKKISVTPIFYKGSIERDSASEADDSTVMAVTLSYGF